MPVDDRTTNRNYQLPSAANFLGDDVLRLRAALASIDADIHARYTKSETEALINGVINGAPGALNTLQELAAALGNDANFAATVINALAAKAPLDSPSFTGTPSAPTPGAGDASTKLATTQFVANNFYNKDTADGRYLQGVPNGSVGTNQLADGALAATTAGRNKMGDGFLLRPKVGESLLHISPAANATGGTLATTSGTSKSFTGIPSWARRVTLMMAGVSVTGASDILLQLGVGSTPMTSGYVNGQSTLMYPSGIVNTTSTNGIPIFNNLGNYVFTGQMVISLIDAEAYTWVVNGNFVSSVISVGSVASGGIATLTGPLGMVRLTTASGTPTFDAGTANIAWE
jgi:hypothetical protein